MAEKRADVSERPPIPSEVREALAGSYTEKGIEWCWTARWTLLSRERMCDVWERDPQRVLDAIDSMNRGDFV